MKTKTLKNKIINIIKENPFFQLAIGEIILFGFFYIMLR